MPQVHQSVLIDEEHGQVKIGEETVVHPLTVLVGPLQIGRKVQIFPGCVIGCSAEHLTRATDWDKPVVIGDGVVLREHVVVQRGIEEDVGTKIGSGCYIMHGCHVAHDCVLEEWVKMAPGVVLGGHSQVMRHAYMGIQSSTHQRVTVGSFSMVGMGSVVIEHVPPGYMVHGVPARCAAWNVIGLRTLGFHLDPENVPREEWGKLMSWQQGEWSRAERTGSFSWHRRWMRGVPYACRDATKSSGRVVAEDRSEGVQQEARGGSDPARPAHDLEDVHGPDADVVEDTASAD